MSYEEFCRKRDAWQKATDHESVRCVFNILPNEFLKRIKDGKFDTQLLTEVKGSDYEVPLYYVTKAWDVILKGTLEPISFMIGPEEDGSYTEKDIREFLREEHATRTRCEACWQNEKMKKLWKDVFNLDINALDIDFLQFDKHLPPNATDEEYYFHFMDVPEGIDEWILTPVNYPDAKGIAHDYVSALMEFTAETLLRRKGKL